MDILPILSTLRRHKITALLLVLEIALTCAIVCNAVFLINQRLERMQMVSGVAEHELV
ncbi:MAG: ABC transporter permease, partial [Frateuria sp.]